MVSPATMENDKVKVTIPPIDSLVRERKSSVLKGQVGSDRWKQILYETMGWYGSNRWRTLYKSHCRWKYWRGCVSCWSNAVRLKKLWLKNHHQRRNYQTPKRKGLWYENTLNELKNPCRYYFYRVFPLLSVYVIHITKDDTAAKRTRRSIEGEDKALTLSTLWVIHRNNRC